MRWIIPYFIISTILISIGVYCIVYSNKRAKSFTVIKINAWGYAVLVFGIINTVISFVIGVCELLIAW